MTLRIKKFKLNWFNTNINKYIWLKKAIREKTTKGKNIIPIAFYKGWNC